MSTQSIARLMNFDPTVAESASLRQSNRLNDLLKQPLPLTASMTQCIYCINCSEFILPDHVPNHSSFCCDLSLNSIRQSQSSILQQAQDQLESMLKLTETADFNSTASNELAILHKLCQQLLSVKQTEQLPSIAQMIDHARNQEALQVWQLRVWLDKICFLAEMLKTGLEELELKDVEEEIQKLKSELEAQKAKAVSADFTVRMSQPFGIIPEEQTENADSIDY